MSGGMRFGRSAAVGNAVFRAALAAVLLTGCGGVGKAVADAAAANRGYVFEGRFGDAVNNSRRFTLKGSDRNRKRAANSRTVGTFKDTRDGKIYIKVAIGGKTWMAENLNYEASGSTCYENNAANCAKYGRLYNWSTSRRACPAGWHLPSDAEWTALTDNVGGSEAAGTRLKSAEGWNDGGGGMDEYKFSALAGGFGYGGGAGFSDAGYYGYWWSATEYNATYAGCRYMLCNGEGVYRGFNGKDGQFSVRCVQD